MPQRDESRVADARSFVLPRLAPSPPGWITAVNADIPRFLLDHASQERKASATNLSLVLHYPDHPQIIDALVGLAREELDHYHQIVRILLQRNIAFVKDEKDPYIKHLAQMVRPKGRERMLDRLVMAAVVEARGTERFRLLAQHLDDPELRPLYRTLAASEAKHATCYLELAATVFGEPEINERLGVFSEADAQAVASLPHRAALH